METQINIDSGIKEGLRVILIILRMILESTK